MPIARKLSGSCEDQYGVQHLAILAFWYLLLGVVQRKRLFFKLSFPKFARIFYFQKIFHFFKAGIILASYSKNNRKFLANFH